MNNFIFLSIILVLKILFFFIKILIFEIYFIMFFFILIILFLVLLKFLIDYFPRFLEDHGVLLKELDMFLTF